MAKGFALKTYRGMDRRGPTDKTLDDLCRRVVFRRDGYACVCCGKACTFSEKKRDGTTRFPGIQWAHIRSRRYRSMRWNPLNSVTLCPGCHYKWHNPPRGFDPFGWFRELRPGALEKIDFLLACAAREKRPLDRQALHLLLERELALRGEDQA